MTYLNSEKIKARFQSAQNSLVLQQSDLSLETLAVMIEKKAIDIEPQFQRRERWDVKKQSALIESFILNIPIPPIYLAEDDYGTYSVIDGKQRLASIYAFKREKMKLSSLENFKEIEGSSFDDLPDSIQNALNIRPYVRVVTLLKQSDPNIKYEVFTRLNTGGEPLLPQEIRNVAYRGKLNDLIYKLAENSFLRKQLKINNQRSKPYRLMVDAEYVLRFFMLLESWNKFSGNMRLSLDSYMKKHQHVDSNFVNNLKEQFCTSIKYCELIWGDNAFKRYATNNNQWRNLVLAGMYDAQMIAVSLLSKNDRELAEKHIKHINTNTIKLFKENKIFDNAIRQFTQNPESIKYRIEEMHKVLMTAKEI